MKHKFSSYEIINKLRFALTNLNNVCNEASEDGYILQYINGPDPQTGKMKIVKLEIFQRVDVEEGVEKDIEEKQQSH